MTSSVFSVILLLIPLAHSTLSDKSSSLQMRPNIVLFMADDLGIGDIGCFGNDTIQTPNIDRIAAEGVKLTHSLATASVCTPSRAAFLTGRYAIRSGLVPTNAMRVNMFLASTSGLPSEEITIGELAQQQGYSTALIGKWHLGIHCCDHQDFCHHPNEQGFDHYYGLPLTNLKDFGKDKETVIGSYNKALTNNLATFAVASIMTSLFLFRMKLVGRMWATLLIIVVAGPVLSVLLVFKNLHVLNGVMMRNKVVVEQPINLDGSAQRLTDESIHFIEKQHADNTPFLLVIPWLQVHTALHAAPEFQGHSKHGRYGDNVENMDHCVGQVLQALDRLGLTNNTFVYFTSDNGGHIEETGRDGAREGGHNGIFRGSKGQGGMDGGIRVPTVARWPGHIAPGSELSHPVSLMDMFPTVARIIEAPLPKDRVIDGVDLMPYLSGEHKTTQVPHELLVHYCGDKIHAARYTSQDGSGDVWKVHFATPNWLEGTYGCDFLCRCTDVTWHDPPMLYNIGKDPAETTLLDTNKHQTILSKIKTGIESHQSGLTSTENQFSFINLFPRPWLQPCCNFPYCKCVEGQ